ncbi:LysR family transcriptional regulator [Primorskyibacter sp. S87]|uniref:LysR family transcriptional regulator n=1 Tax=Primorskyibacter sp. S87 TaxID=3415126 RepID=UPI003C7C4685
MISLRELEFISSLARRKHFARAAEDCGVSQPAFSMRIRKIEEQLGAAIVKRGNRFQGFTAEGETLVRHARKIMDDLKVMEQEIRSERGEVTGLLSVGVIPTAAIFAARAIRRLQGLYPGIRVRLETATSLAIQQGLEDGRFEAGFTYGEGVSRDMLRADPLYQEAYYLLAPVSLIPQGKSEISWAEAAELPLSLLEPNMQNRRILDKVFRDAGLVPDVVSETSEFTASMVLAAEGASATIVPKVHAETFGVLDGAVALPLVNPKLEKEVCLVAQMRDPSLPTVAALRKVCLTVQ